MSVGFDGTELAVGSGAIVRHPTGARSLATAWHNLSGRHPESNSCLSPSGGVPNQLRLRGCGFDFRANLYSGDNNPNHDQALFLAHPSGSSTDVALFPIPPSQRFDHPLHESFLSPRLNLELPLRAGQTCFILGFPEGITHEPLENVIFPIWKTGHIASEPMFNFGGQPKLLIDATTRRGMSGAIVVVSENGRNRLVGIYSGRYKQAPSGNALEDKRGFTTELGWVYRAEVISEIIQRTGPRERSTKPR